MTDLHVRIRPTRFVASVLPEGHDDRWTYALQVEYRGEGQWSVRCRGQYLAADGTRSHGFCWSGGADEPATSAEMDLFDKEQAEWLAVYRFDEVTALRIAEEQAKTLTYRGRSVADVLAERVPR